MSIRRVERIIRNLRRNVETIGIAKDARQRYAHRDSAKIREQLISKLEAVRQGKPLPATTSESLTQIESEQVGRTRDDLMARFSMMAEGREERARQEYLKFLRTAAGGWTRALKPRPVVEESDPKVVPISSKTSSGGIGSAFGEVNAPDYDPDYSNLKGPSEAGLWEWLGKNRR